MRNAIRRFGNCLLLCTMLLVPWGSSNAGVSTEKAKETIREFNSRMRAVRDPAELLPVAYVEFQGRSYACVLPRRFARLASKGETFRIEKLKAQDRTATFRAVTAAKTEMTLTVQSYGKWTTEEFDNVFPLILSEVFDFREAGQTDRIVANIASEVFHLRGCNHLPAPSQRKLFASKSAAETAGFKACTVCFGEESIPLEGYGPRRAEATEAARLYEIAFPPSSNAAMQDRVEQIGEKLLDRFPLPTHGYEYRFRVVKSGIPNACSYPTGFVYVTDALMSAIEDSLELEFVLAHEIAHVELPEFEEAAEPPELRAPSILLQELLEDPRRKRWGELEKDLIALECVRGSEPSPDALARARGGLLKLQFVQESEPGEVATWNSTHPTFADRLALFDSSRFVFAPLDTRICGISEHGDTLASVRVLGRSKGVIGEVVGYPVSIGSDYRTGQIARKKVDQIYLLVETTDFANKNIDKLGGKLEQGGGDVVLAKTWVPAPIVPGTAHVVPVPVWGGAADDQILKGGELDIGVDVKRWVVMTGGR
jgi:hypothetical protein